MDPLKSAISKVFTEQFENVSLKEVHVMEDVDQDGDEVLRIEFIFEMEADKLDPEKVKSLIRHLREPLEELHERRFPVVRFMTTEEQAGEAA